jgi:hypothetical protein
MEKRVIIKKLLLEVAGISFEVRKWAQIIENYVSEYIKNEREKLKTQTPQTPKTQTKPTQISYKEEDEYTSLFTHFGSVDNNLYYNNATVQAEDLYINADVSDSFPGIKNIIKGSLIEVEFDNYGYFMIDFINSEVPEDYLDGIIEMIEDHMAMGKPFYTEGGEEVFAVNDSKVRSPNYMTENYRWDNFYKQYTPQPKIDKIEINGKGFPDAYEDFKVDKWVITNSTRIEYDHWKSGYDESGEYVVYLNMPMSSIGGSALVHEIKHAYDDWNRMSRGAPPIRDSWEIKNIYTPDFEKLVLGGSFKLHAMLQPIIRYYYLGSKLESPAYLENEYDSSYSSQYRDAAQKLIKFKASNFLDKNGGPAKGLQESWDDLIKNYDIPFFRKFSNVVDFLNYTEKHFNKRGRNILKRIDKMRYIHNKPLPKKITTPYNPPVTSRPSVHSKEYLKLELELDKLEDEYDVKYAAYKLNRDPDKMDELIVLDRIIGEKLRVLNSLY